VIALLPRPRFKSSRLQTGTEPSIKTSLFLAPRARCIDLD